MLKTILNLDGAQELSKKEQKSINGGAWPICCTQYTAQTGCTSWNQTCCQKEYGEYCY